MSTQKRVHSKEWKERRRQRRIGKHQQYLMDAPGLKAKAAKSLDGEELQKVLRHIDDNVRNCAIKVGQLMQTL